MASEYVTHAECDRSHEGLQKQLEASNDNEAIWSAIDKLRSHIHPVVAAILALQTGALGSTLTIIAVMSRGS